MPSSPCGSPLPLHFPPCAIRGAAGAAGQQQDGNEPLPLQHSIPWSLSARAGGAEPVAEARLRWDGDSGWLSVHMRSGLGPVPCQAGTSLEADSFNLTPGLL